MPKNPRSRGDTLPPLGKVEIKLLKLLGMGPMTTTCLTSLVAMEELGLAQPDELRVQPAYAYWKRRHRRILSSLRRLERKELIVGEPLAIALTEKAFTQFKWWRLLSPEEKREGRVDVNLSQRCLKRVILQARESLRRIERVGWLMRGAAEGESSA